MSFLEKKEKNNKVEVFVYYFDCFPAPRKNNFAKKPLSVGLIDSTANVWELYYNFYVIKKEKDEMFSKENILSS